MEERRRSRAKHRLRLRISMKLPPQMAPVCAGDGRGRAGGRVWTERKKMFRFFGDVNCTTFTNGTI